MKEEGMARSGLYPYPGKEVVRCHVCGRSAVRGRRSTEYVFGLVCGRADCRKVDRALGDEFRCREMTIALPVQGGDGVPSCWSIEGEPSGMA